MSNKRERPGGVNLLQWLKNQEIPIANGSMLHDRLAQREDIKEWPDRAAPRNVPVQPRAE